MTCSDGVEEGRPDHLTPSDDQLRELLPATVPIPAELHTAVARGEAHRDTLVVFVSLWRLTDIEIGAADPSYGAIAEVSGMSRKQAIRMVGQLVELGFVTKYPCKNMYGGHLSNYYTLDFSRRDGPTP